MLQVLVGSAAYYFGLGDLLRKWNDLDEASRHLSQGMELVRGKLTVDATVVTQGYTALARLEMARGDYSRALATLESFAHLARERHFVPHLVAHGLAVRAEVELAQDHLAAAIRWADASDLSTDDEELSYSREGEYLTLAQELVITVGTVKRHVNSIYTKLGVSNRTQAVARAHACNCSRESKATGRVPIYRARGRPYAIASVKINPTTHPLIHDDLLG